MRGHPAYQHHEKSESVEQARQRHKEDCELRLAKIQNSGRAANTPWDDKVAEHNASGKRAGT